VLVLSLAGKAGGPLFSIEKRPTSFKSGNDKWLSFSGHLSLC